MPPLHAHPIRLCGGEARPTLSCGPLDYISPRKGRGRLGEGALEEKGRAMDGITLSCPYIGSSAEDFSPFFRFFSRAG